MFSSNASQVSSDANYIESCFSTYLYTGTGVAQTITNGIDLAGEGGLVWTKARDIAITHWLVDNARGVSKGLVTNTTAAEVTDATEITSFNSNGYSIGISNNNKTNLSPYKYASWTFRKQPKFFDVVTYTGNGSDPRNIAHNLGSVPGSMIIKCTSTGATDWFVYHRSLGNSQSLNLNQTGAAETGTQVWGTTTPTSTVFTVGNINSNTNGRTYVAYLFAHDAGGFGLSGNENVVSCGSFTTNGSGVATVNLGYEPQWILVKDTLSARNWRIIDNMRGWINDGTITTADDMILAPNLSSAEFNGGGGYPFATGFTYAELTNSNYIYIAIRRGPMKVPTDGTTVFSTDIALDNATPSAIAGFVTDMMITSYRNGSNEYPSHFVANRLVGGNLALLTNSTAAESGYGAFGGWDNMVGSGTAVLQNYPVSNMAWMFRRAPSFFDEVCYTGTGSAMTVAHNLGVAPELLIVKKRNAADRWNVYHKDLYSIYGPPYNGIALNTTEAFIGRTMLAAQPTSTNFEVAVGNIESSGATYVAYLFATCLGVSKVGSYTGTGTTQAIACGFTTGARFVLIKRTDSTGDWYVWDSARGIVANSDPYLLLNSTAAEVTGTDYIDPSSAGFEISSTAPAAINASGGSFIFLAIS